MRYGLTSGQRKKYAPLSFISLQFAGREEMAETIDRKGEIDNINPNEGTLFRESIEYTV